ncbi:MAG: DUF4129 domain-containing protein [Planctomycetaceae bacterium]|nr:DUF4129 domain-containing protein [Planctomycetaceae bacterium]
MNRYRLDRRRRPWPAALASALIALGVSTVTPAAEPSDTDRVTQIQGELSKFARYPWYDSAQDDLQTITVPPPREPWFDWKWNFSGFNFNFSLGELLRLLTWLLFAALLTWIIYKLCQTYLRREASQATWASNELDSADDRIEHEALPLPTNEHWGDLLDRARQFFEQGNYRQAMIYLFSHQLVELNRQQVIHLSKGKTNRQYLREVRRQSTLAPLFERSIETFELAFFGNAALSREQFESVWRSQGEFQQQLASLGTSS